MSKSLLRFLPLVRIGSQAILHTTTKSSAATSCCTPFITNDGDTSPHKRFISILRCNEFRKKVCDRNKDEDSNFTGLDSVEEYDKLNFGSFDDYLFQVWTCHLSLVIKSLSLWFMWNGVTFCVILVSCWVGFLLLKKNVVPRIRNMEVPGSNRLMNTWRICAVPRNMEFSIFWGRTE